MSQAFVRENDDLWLHDVSPTMNALIAFLTNENGGIRVYEQKNYTDNAGKQVHVMSNGLSYSKDERGKWEVVV
ncbi:hypothetical protein [Ohtaekwangia koreensis]|uniref:Uncharacterized protein n=1 Tax=Ohtaekwangia koreensis TaxID=688867 RepID=A0A1T5LAC9_9BACT|nr:hypothetical protein [Ohtaekwangia koreensis]SKC72903.1 hypothetical protein SAMN05660236_2829 [Ohtaekwangia koreensis]